MLIAYLSTLRIRGPPQYQAYVLAVAYKTQHDLTSVSSLTSFPIALSSISGLLAVLRRYQAQGTLPLHYFALDAASA